MTSYLVLARKWRPQTFDEIVGQEHVCRTLKNAIEAGRVAHAYLFAGQRGVGKTTVARILAKALNCEKGATSSPCGACIHCTEVALGNSIDVAEIDGASNTSVDDVRDIRERVRYAPVKARHKVYIIDEVHMLSKAAFNALLKTLEEPPSNTYFIFATTEPEKVPPTVLSRCQRFDFRKLTSREIIDHIGAVAEKEGLKVGRRALSMIAFAADGSMRDAQSILDRLISSCGGDISDADVESLLGFQPKGVLASVVQAIKNGAADEALAVAKEVALGRGDVAGFCSELATYLRHLLLAKAGAEKCLKADLGEEESAEVAAASHSFSIDELYRYLNLLLQAQEQLKYAQNQRLVLEMALIKMMQVKSLMPLEEILTKLGSIEARLVGAGQSEGQAQISFEESEPALEPLRPEAEVTPQASPKEGAGDVSKGIINYLKSKKASLGHILSGCRAKFSGERKLIFEMPPNNPLFNELAKDASTMALIKEAAREVLGSDYAVELSLTQGAQKAAAEGAAQGQGRPQTAASPEIIQSGVIKEALEIFGGKVVAFEEKRADEFEGEGP